MKTMNFQHKLVDHIPDRPESGVLYVSERFATAVHLCACGCGMEVVTPLKLGRWKLSISDKGASLYPSIGNWSFPCRSHYWISEGRVRWASDMSKARVNAVRTRDAKDIEASLRVADACGEEVATDQAGPPPTSVIPEEMPTSLWLKLRHFIK